MSTTTPSRDVPTVNDPKSLEEPSFLEKVYNGEANFGFVAQRRRWYWIYAFITLACFLVIALRGFTLGIDLEGGTKLSVPPANGATETTVTEVVEDAIGVSPQSVQTVGSGASEQIEVASERLSDEQIQQARLALYEEFEPLDNNGNPSPDAIGDSTVSESWGQSVTERMAIGMAVFLVIVFIYITVRMERDMAISAIVSLLLDGIVVAGIYALVGFEVSPATIIGLLTVLAYSLYDTVIVFDKVHENTQDVLQLHESDLRRTSEPGDQPDGDAFAEHLTVLRGADRRPPRHRRLADGRGHAQGPGAGPVHRRDRRYGQLHLLLRPAAGHPEVQAEEGRRAQPSRGPCPRARRRPRHRRCVRRHR